MVPKKRFTMTPLFFREYLTVLLKELTSVKQFSRTLSRSGVVVYSSVPFNELVSTDQFLSKNYRPRSVPFKELVGIDQFLSKN